MGSGLEHHLGTDRPGGRSPGVEATRILAFGRARLGERAEYANVASAFSVLQYVAVASEVAGWLRHGRILDWGAGWGQNSVLLRAYGLDVVAYDVEDKGAAAALLAGTDVPYVVSPGARLPFATAEFQAILNCGVLEHVADERGALAELARVLAPGGWLFTFHLPNRYAYAEWLGRRLGRFYHERTYTKDDAVTLFADAGFRVLRCRPFHLLPRNVWAWAGVWAAESQRLGRALEWLDRGLVRVPGLARLATAWALVARRRS